MAATPLAYFTTCVKCIAHLAVNSWYIVYRNVKALVLHITDGSDDYFIDLKTEKMHLNSFYCMQLQEVYLVINCLRCSHIKMSLLIKSGLNRQKQAAADI